MSFRRGFSRACPRKKEILYFSPSCVSPIQVPKKQQGPHRLIQTLLYFQLNNYFVTSGRKSENEFVVDWISTLALPLLGRAPGRSRRMG